jgi:hypothetical protein
MPQGFIVEIVNSTSEAQEIKLFADSLPNGVLVTTMDKAYNFDTLQMIARQNRFIGDSITRVLRKGYKLKLLVKTRPKK